MIETSSHASPLLKEYITVLTHENTLGLSQDRTTAPTLHSSRWTADLTVPKASAASDITTKGERRVDLEEGD